MADKVYEPQTIKDQPIFGEGVSLNTTQQTSNNVFGNVEISPQPLPKRNEILTASLNTKTRRILGEYKFTQQGAIQIGKYESGITGDLRLSPSGITARNSSGVTTFAIDATTGDATFLGTIEAGSVISEGTISGGSITIGTGNNVFKVDANGNMWLGNTAYASAPFKVSNTGALVATSVSVSGKLTTGAGSTINGTYVDSLSANKLTAGTIDASVINVTNINANNISSGTINASVIGVTNLNASNITTGTLSANFITGGSLVVGGSSNELGIISVKNSLSTEITRMNNSGIIVRNTRGLFFEQTTAGSYFDISVNASNQAVFSLPTTNQFFIKNYAGTSNLFTVSATSVFAGSNFSCNGSVTCKELWLNYGQNEGHLRSVDQIKGYNDLRLYSDGRNDAIYFYSSSGGGDLSMYPYYGDFYSTGTKYFKIKHPEDPENKWIQYTSVESPEVALTIRGVGKLVKGKAIISTPHHWDLVTVDYLTTVNVTPLDDCNGLFVPKKSLNRLGFEVRELSGGTSNIEFTWELTATRKGYEDFNPEPTNQDLADRSVKAMLEEKDVTEEEKLIREEEQKARNRIISDLAIEKYNQIIKEGKNATRN